MPTDGDPPVGRQEPVFGPNGRGCISREWTVWCGRCARWHQGTENMPRAAAERLGWKRDRAYGWLCRTCVKERPDAQD